MFFRNIFSLWLCPFCLVIQFFSSPPQRPMTSDFKGFLYQILSIQLLSYLNSWERASISLLMFSAKQGNYWYYFWYDAVLDWGLKPGPPALWASTLLLSINCTDKTVTNRTHTTAAKLYEKWAHQKLLFLVSSWVKGVWIWRVPRYYQHHSRIGGTFSAIKPLMQPFTTNLYM